MIATYCKIADSAVDAGLGPYAGWLYTVIVRHMNRKQNELRKTVKELAALAGMSAKSVMRYTKVLEAKNLLSVQRSQTTEVADVNVYSLAGESASISLFNGVPASPTPSPSQSLVQVPQSPRKDSDSEMNTPNGEEYKNQSQSKRERFLPEGIDQSKFVQDDPNPDPETLPTYLRQQVPTPEQRRQLTIQKARLGETVYAEVIARCANAHSWEYVLKALASEPAPTPPFRAPPYGGSAPARTWSEIIAERDAADIPPSPDESTQPDETDDDNATPDIDPAEIEAAS